MADILDKQAVGGGSGVPLGGIIRLAPSLPDDVEIEGQRFIRSGLAVSNADPSLPDSAIGDWEVPPVVDSDLENDAPIAIAINDVTGVGFICGSITYSATLTVYKTTNFGASWVREEFTNPAGTSFRPRTIINRGDSWVMIDDINSRRIIYTLDNGNTWSTKILTLTGTAIFTSSANIGFIDDVTIGVGYWAENANMNLNTHSLPSTSFTTTNRVAIPSGNMGKFGGITEASGTIIAALTTVGAGSNLHNLYVVRSVNNGTTWTNQDLSSLRAADQNNRFYGIESDGAGRWIVGHQFGALISTDDGLTWSNISGVTGSIYDVATDGSGNWVLLRNGTQFYRSSDDGVTWVLETAPSDGQIVVVGSTSAAKHLQFVDKSLLFVGRQSGIKRNRVGFGIELTDPDAASYFVRYL